MAERYRDLVGPQGVDLNARMTPSGSPEAANELASTFANFSRQTHAVGSFFREQAGQREGAEAGQSGDPEFRRGVRALTAYGRAYNSAALRSYAIRSEQDLAVQAARIEAEAGTDPEVFAKSMDAIRKATIEEAPPEARAILEEVYANRTAQGLARINVKLAEDLRKEDQILVEDEVERLTSEIAGLMVTDATGEELSLKETQLEMLIQSAERDSTLTKGQAGALRRGAAKRVRHESVLEQFRGELDAADGDPIGFIEDLKELNRVSEDLTPQEEQQLVNALFQEMNERARLANARESETVSAAEAVMEAGERFATVAVLRGDFRQEDIARMTERQQLKPDVARTLSNMIKARAESPMDSDPDTLLQVSLNKLRYSETEILQMDDLSHDDKLRIIEDRRKEEDGWQGSAKAKEAYRRIDGALKIPPGQSLMLLSKETLQQRNDAMTELFNEMEALPPEDVPYQVIPAAERIVKRFESEEAVRKQQTQLDIAMRKDTEDFTDEEIAAHEEVIRVLQQNLEQLRNQVPQR